MAAKKKAEKKPKKVTDKFVVRVDRVLKVAADLLGDEAAERLRGGFEADAQLAAVAKACRRDVGYVPEHEDPREELRLLAWRRRGIIRTRNAIQNMCADKVAKVDDPRRGIVAGQTIKSPLPDDVRLFCLDGADRLNEDKNAPDQFRSLAGINAAIEHELGRDPVYTEFLAHVAGLGPATAGILLGMIDFAVCDTPSRLLRFCGQATYHGPEGRRHLESRVHKDPGSPLRYCSDVRTALWNWTNSAARTSRFGRAWSSKYLDAWLAYKQRMAHSPRRIDGANLIAFTPEEAALAAAAFAAGEKVRKVGSKMMLGGVEVRSAKAFIQKTGAHKMTDALLYDLYLVGRAHAGLPVSVTWHEKARGFTHGDHVTVDPLAPPRLVSFEEALAMVGDVGQRAPVFVFADADEEAAALAAE